jgi:hypothetical protein
MVISTLKQFQKQKRADYKSTTKAWLQILCLTFESLLEDTEGWKRKRQLGEPFGGRRHNKVFI